MESHQGAGFAFDLNMDFSNVFATKPIEGETSNSFFFGDEGIDTTASFLDPIMFPQQTAFDMQQTLTLDNTSGSNTAWNGQPTPSQNALNTFPLTPTQSFDSVYQQDFSSLGKRPLQLDADLPQAKRQEVADFTTTSLFSSVPYNPAASIEIGISDEAADMCATWFQKYAILPSDRHIDSLSQLTGESADAIRHWFGRLMKQGMGSGGDSAYKSQTAANHFWDSFEVPQLPLEESTQESFTTPNFTTPDFTTAAETATISPPANALRGGKKTRCTPTDDRTLLSRDPKKVYQCTRGCGKRYGRKCDWKRNEEEGYPCKSWMCSLCTTQGVDNVKPCFRKYHFAQHFRNIHPGVNIDAYEEMSVVCSETEFPRKCGFCKHRFASRQERIDHIADHFKQGKCMLDWNDSDDSQDSDNTDDDDDKPSDDGSDGSRPSYQPPDCDPRGDSEPKYYGGGSDSLGGGGSGGSQGGFFQFQLSQLNDGQSGSQSSRADQPINPTNQSSQIQQRTRCASEPLFERSDDQPSSAGQWYTRSNLDAPKRDNAHALARDAVSGALVQQELDARAVKDQDRVPDGQHTAAVDATAKKMDAHALLASRQHKTGAESKTDSSAIDGCSDRPKGPIEARSDEIEFTPIDDIVTSQAMAPLGQGRTSSPGLPPPESKMVSDQLTRGQGLQTIATTSQSFLSVRFLGSGGFSTVDEVVHRSTKLRLGRKTLKNRDPAAIKELWKEVNVLQKLRHPHVIRFLGAYSKGDKMSMLLSPIADTTLALWLDRHKQDRPANFGQMITKMFGCLASSVRYLHEQRPVVKHMDIKPQNILIVEGDGEFPHVVLCDFGISSSDDLTDGRIQPLTRQYVAPEAFEGFTRKQAADIWSLGCVWTEMASVHYGQANSSWTDLREEFSGRATKYYWQDVPGLQSRLTSLLDEAATMIECTVVRTLKSMLSARPDERPDAVALTMLFTPASCCLSWPNEKAAYPGPQEELSSVEMIIHEDGVDCRAQLHQHGHDPAGPPGMSSAKSWIEQCSHTHDACSHAAPRNAKTLPTRLVDICPDGQAGSSIRIVDSASIESLEGPVDYVTLSHVWSQSDATLTTERLQTPHAQADIPLSMLSPALNAAITATRGLEYRYLWIDALCVVQNDPDDKRKECASMASTFRNAALTLVLDNIDNGTNDFKESFAKANGTGVATASSGFASDTRAWALQERLLSHRFLHLGQEQMYWECNSLKASETFPQGLPSLVWEKAHTKSDDTQPRPKIDNGPVARKALQSHGSKPDQLAANDHYPRQARTLANSKQHLLRRTDVCHYQCTSMQAPQTMKPHALRRHEPHPHTTEAPLSSSPTCCEVPHIRHGTVFVTAQGTVKSKIQDGLASTSTLSSSSTSCAGQEISMSGQMDQNGNGNGSTKSAIAIANAKAASTSRNGNAKAVSVGGDTDMDGNEDGRNGNGNGDGDGDGDHNERLHNGGYMGVERME